MKLRDKWLIAACTGLLCAVGAPAVAQQAPAGEATSTRDPVDARLEKRIDTRLQSDQKLKVHKLDASVRDGVVTLTGTVRTAAEKARAERLARTKGVNDVENLIALEDQATTQQSTTTPGPQGGTELAVPPPSEAQPPSEGTIRERNRVEQRNERAPQPQQPEGTPSRAGSDQSAPKR